MCVECLAPHNGPFTVTNDGSMGDKGVAMKDNPRYTGDPEKDKKFEDMAPGKTDKASTIENTGRQ